jgi:hypothetical protein
MSLQVLLVALAATIALAQNPEEPEPAPKAPKPTEPVLPAAESRAKRIELNLLGKTDAASGESRRNENIQFNLVDNNALKELNVRLGTSATIHDFQPERGYFGAEFGNPPSTVPHLAPLVKAVSPTHASLYWNHQNSAFSARSFFQVGSVKPARDNDYGITAGVSLWRGGHLTLSGSQQKIRGIVNGNVLVPMADERTALADSVDQETK